MLTRIAQAIEQGNLYDIEEIVGESLDSGAAAADALQAMIRGLQKSGEHFEAGEFFLPELTMSAEAFKAGMRVLEPLLRDSPRQYKGTIVMGTVSGDVHDIGKNLVGFMLESAGIKVIDLGVDVPPERFVEAVKEERPDFLGLSALLTTTMLGMENVLQKLREAGLRRKVKVIIGGAPVSSRFARHIAADAYASEAPSGVRKIQEMLNEAKQQGAGWRF